MRQDELILDDDADGGLRCVIELVHVPFLLKRLIPTDHMVQQIDIVVCAESRTIHEPHEVGSVARERHRDRLGRYLALWIEGNGADGRGEAEIVVLAGEGLGCGEGACGLRSGVLIGSVVVDGCDALGNDAGDEGAACAGEGVAGPGAHPEGVACFARRFDLGSYQLLISSQHNHVWKTHDNIRALSHSQSDHIRRVRLDSNEVIRDDRHIMPINRDLEQRLRRRINQPQPILFPRRKPELGDPRIRLTHRSRVLARIVHLAINQDIIRQRQPPRHRRLHQREVISMVPIINKHRAEILVVRHPGGVGTVDDDRPEGAAGVLRAVVGVVPGGADVVGAEAVGEGFAGGDGALLHGGDAVVVGGFLLDEAVPVEGCAFALVGGVDGEVVGHGDLDPEVKLAGLYWMIGGMRDYQSPQLASTSGPGNAPLTTRPFFCTPSGAIVL